MSNTKKPGSYADSGVDTHAADHFVEGIQSMLGASQSGAMAARLKDGVGAYAAVYEWVPEAWTALACDGVGTKILWTLEGLGSPEDLAQDLVAMNVNDLLCVGARPQLFLDYVGFTHGDLLKEGALLPRFLKGLQVACAKSGALLVGGETAQMPDFYRDNHFDVSGFCVGHLAPQDWLHAELLQPGSDVWVWKSEGPHANGFSWLRKIFDVKDDASFIREELMAPTRLYVEDFLNLKALLAAKGQTSSLQGAFHITGSGLKNMLRLQPKGRAIGFEFELREDWPRWFLETEKRTGASREELLSSFNAGWGMALVLDPKCSQELGAELQSLGLFKVGQSIDSAQVRMGDWRIQ